MSSALSVSVRVNVLESVTALPKVAPPDCAIVKLARSLTAPVTAIVVQVATLGVSLALVSAIYRKFGTLDEDELIEKLK